MSFKAVEAKISKKEGIPIKNAGAILAKSSRNASPAAKAKNPKLKRVKMPKKSMASSMGKNMLDMDQDEPKGKGGGYADTDKDGY